MQGAPIGRTQLRWLTWSFWSNPLLLAAIVGVFVLWVHWGSGRVVFRSQVSLEPGWVQFRSAYSLNEFGEDGYFVRAAQNGYNVFYHTPKYAARFTRKTAAAEPNACAGCHSAEQMAISFVNSDRYDARLGRRVSFEERITRCFAGPMEGFVPTLYDPVVRDLRIFARAVAHHLQLSEGARDAAIGITKPERSTRK